MKRIALVALALGMLAPSRPASGQLDFAAGISGGSLGVTADFSVSVTDRVALRTGATMSGLSAGLDGQFGSSSQHTGTLGMPDGTFRAGVDFQFDGVRLGTGLMVWADSPSYDVAVSPGGTISIGGNSYTGEQVSLLSSSLESSSRAPYVLLGFGSTAANGLGMFMDLGAVLLSDAAIEIGATGDQALIGTAGFQRALEAEALLIEEEVGALLNFWPILTLGLRYGF